MTNPDSVDRVAVDPTPDVTDPTAPVDDPQSKRCGNYAGYVAHLLRGEATCQPCRDAKARYMRQYRRRPLDACKRGELPAEALSTKDRERVVAELWQSGRTDVQIAEITSMSTYTSARIRARLGLAPHRPVQGVA